MPESVQEIKSAAVHDSDTLKTVKVYGKSTILDDCSIGVKWDTYNDKYTVDEDAVSYGYKDSTAQAYAEKTGVTFKDLEDNAVPENVWYTGEDGKEYWYENGVRRVRPIEEGEVHPFATVKSGLHTVRIG